MIGIVNLPHLQANKLTGLEILKLKNVQFEGNKTLISYALYKFNKEIGQVQFDV